MHVWTHLRPPKPIVHLDTFFNALNSKHFRKLFNFIFWWQNFNFSWIFSIKAKNVKLSRGLKPLCYCVCLIVLFFFACQFCKLSPFQSTPKSLPPLPDPLVKLNPRLYDPLLRHCICIMCRKHWIRGKAVELLKIWKVKISRL
jgi:hypothetical protein